MNPIRQKNARHGKCFYNVNDTFIGRSIHLYGEWSEAEIHLFSQIVRPGDVVLEAGANIGTHTLALSRLAGATGRVHAFEPQDYTHQLLCANLISNSCVNTSVYQSAVGAQDGFVDMLDADIMLPNNFGAASLLYKQGGNMRKVPLRTIDSLQLQRLDFLKADIEGFELEMLAGSGETLRRCRPVVFIETMGPGGDSTAALRDYFTALDYQCWHYITPLFNPRNFDGWPHNEFPGIWSFDMLCVPAGRAVVSGLDDAMLHPAREENTDRWLEARFAHAGAAA